MDLASGSTVGQYAENFRLTSLVSQFRRCLFRILLWGLIWTSKPLMLSVILMGFYPSSRRLIRTSLLIIDSDDKCLMRGISDVKSASGTSPVHRDWPFTPSTSSSPIRFRCQKFHSYISQDSCTSRHFQFLSSTRSPIASLPRKNVGSESEGANDFVKALARNLFMTCTCRTINLQYWITGSGFIK